MQQRRKSGIILHPTSLPGRFGIGDLGPEAYRFAGFLAETGQGLWQVLPLGHTHTGLGNSPYMSFSSFGGNPYLISLEKLADEWLLDRADIQNIPSFPEARVDYGWVREYKMSLLRKSFETFRKRHRRRLPPDFSSFTEGNVSWLEDYALFMALKQAHGEVEWTKWDEGARDRQPDALVSWRNRLATDVLFFKYVQHQFSRQWSALKDYCHGRGIEIIGDIPIYVAHDSADVWAHRDLFYLDDRGLPLVVAGVPPDYFSATGQRWGNPIYRWDVMAEQDYDWWIKRFRMNLAMVDIVRLDHFRGLEAYWEIPASEPTAVNGRWVKGPGASLFRAVESALGKLPVIAEDLGVITPEVDALREAMGFPGMRVLQMAFGDDPKSREDLPHNHVKDCVVYTATHDNNTTLGWFTAEPGTGSTQTREEIERERCHVLEYVGCDGREINWDFIRLAQGSVALTAIYPLQDVLGLGSEARMNFPARSDGNWEWRFLPGTLTPAVCDRLRRITAVCERSPTQWTPPGREITKLGFSNSPPRTP